MPEETDTRKEKRERPLPSLGDLKKRVDDGVKNHLPGEAGIASVEDRYIVELKDPDHDKFGTLGKNFRTAWEGIKDIESPAKANEVYFALKGVYEEANLEGGKF